MGERMEMTGESKFEWAQSSGMMDEASRQSRFAGNFTIPVFKPWGNQGGVAAVSVLFTVWIVLANAFLIAVILTSRHLRKQRATLYVIQIALADLAVGVFYCPLAADFYIKQIWTHGCQSLFLWNSFLYISTFMSTHALGLINLNRLLGVCCRLRLGSRVKLALTLTLIVLLWVYLVMFAPSLLNMKSAGHVLIYPKTKCNANMSNEGNLAASMLAYFAPGIVSVILLSIIILYENFYKPTHEELNRPESPVFTLKVLSGANFVGLGMCLPCFVTIVSLSQGSCASVNCIHWILPVSTVFEWILFAKSGIQPLIWLLNPAYKTAMLPVVRFIKRQPGMDTTELVEADDASQDSDCQGDGSDNNTA